MVERMGEAEEALHAETQQLSYGLAWVVESYRGWKVVGHTGILDGFRAHLAFVPRARLGLVVLANLYATRLNLALIYTLLDRLLGLEARNWNASMLREVQRQQAAAAKFVRERFEQRKRGTRPSKPLRAYAGQYEHPAYGMMRLSANGDRLVWRWSNFQGELEHFHFDTFLVQPRYLGPFGLTFILNAAGDVTSLFASSPFGLEFRRK
jgi:hypothetical protein